MKCPILCSIIVNKNLRFLCNFTNNNPLFLIVNQIVINNRWEIRLINWLLFSLQQTPVHKEVLLIENYSFLYF